MGLISVIDDGQFGCAALFDAHLTEIDAELLDVKIRTFVGRDAHSTYTLTVVAQAEGVTPVLGMVTEAHAPSASRVARFEGTCPIKAGGTVLGEHIARVKACRRYENRLPVGTRDQMTIHAVSRRPCPFTPINQFFLLYLGRHAPRATQVHIGGIVIKIQIFLVVHCTIRAIGTVLCQRVLATVTPLVGAPIIVVLGFGLAPGEVVAVVLRVVGTDVHCRPQRAAGQSQVNILRNAIVVGTRLDRNNALTSIKYRASEGHVAAVLAGHGCREHHGHRNTGVAWHHDNDT